MRKVTIAPHAGFCFGVRRATELIEERMRSSVNERIYTLGRLIHNDIYNSRLDAAGVVSINAEDIADIAASTERDGKAVVFARAHGIPKQTEALLRECAEKYENFSLFCPFTVK